MRTQRRSTQTAAKSAKTDDTYGRYKEFAIALDLAMKRAGLNASQLAKRAWGLTTDSRGYSVGRNRDRIGHYLAGTSFPEPENLERLAKGLGVPTEELASTRPAAAENPERQNPRRSTRSDTGSTGELVLTELPAQPTKTRLQVDRVVHWEVAEQIRRILKQDETRRHDPINPDVGKIVGGTDIENNGTK